MNKELCFCLDGKELFLDKVLVAFNDTPIFFVCRAVNQYYIALCIDIDELEYIIVDCQLRMLFDMLSGKIEMRSLFTSVETYWHVIAGNTIYEDVTTKHLIDSLEMDYLPLPGAYYEATAASDREYADRICDAYLNEVVFEEVALDLDAIQVIGSMTNNMLTEKYLFEQYIDIFPVHDNGNGFKGPTKEFSSVKSVQSFPYKEQIGNCTAVRTASIPVSESKEVRKSALLAA